MPDFFLVMLVESIGKVYFGLVGDLTLLPPIDEFEAMRGIVHAAPLSVSRGGGGISGVFGAAPTVAERLDERSAGKGSMVPPPNWSFLLRLILEKRRDRDPPLAPSFIYGLLG